MPRHDRSGPAYRGSRPPHGIRSPFLGSVNGRKRRPPKGGEMEREPVAPDKPKDLSGGAAAPLEYDN